MKQPDPGSLPDPQIATPIEATLAAYRGLLSDDDLREMRELLEDVLSSHPTAVLLHRRLGPAAAPTATEEAALETAPAAAPDRRRAGGDSSG
jgi:hypothetical protein